MDDDLLEIMSYHPQFIVYSKHLQLITERFN